ncbi:MAG TPA: nitronate monooxygenase [Alphaproteobacteria bacterium]|nr:MAG: nitronate monooxygenase [SAR116 cluster bacterium]HCY47715.1 nitronate monooxygenase [Alphaproteobacteria bacterium]|tara:strand:+ start:593 stop:1591 length:999 start_codon:yes stop_codon:yes gene_type:complete
MNNMEIFGRLSLPMVASPLFLISNPKMVVAQCKAGVVGSFPALNAREDEGDPPALDHWLRHITEELDRHNQENPDHPAAPFAVNQIVHRSNLRLDRDLEICHRWKVPIWITSLGAREEVNVAAHDCGGVTLHDVINNKFARKAIEKGADGLVAVAAGAGGHAGQQSPFALIQEIREWFDGPLLLSGAIATGRALLAAQAMGADYGYVGSAFIATHEANAQDEYKDMIVGHGAEDIVYTSYFTGVPGNYLKPSIEAQGLDSAELPERDSSAMNFSSGSSKAKNWKDIWGAGQGIGAVKECSSVADLVARFEREYQEALSKIKEKTQTFEGGNQ